MILRVVGGFLVIFKNSFRSFQDIRFLRMLTIHLNFNYSIFDGLTFDELQILLTLFLIWLDTLLRVKSTLIASCTTGKSTHQSTYCLLYLVWWSLLLVKAWHVKITRMSPINWSVLKKNYHYINFYYHLSPLNTSATLKTHFKIRIIFKVQFRS